MKLSITRPVWEQQVAFLPLSRMSWEQLRATVVFEPERRTWAWCEMERRSIRTRVYGSEAAKQFGREHGH